MDVGVGGSGKGEEGGTGVEECGAKPSIRKPSGSVIDVCIGAFFVSLHC